MYFLLNILQVFTGGLWISVFTSLLICSYVYSPTTTITRVLLIGILDFILFTIVSAIKNALFPKTWLKNSDDDKHKEETNKEKLNFEPDLSKYYDPEFKEVLDDLYEGRMETFGEISPSIILNFHKDV